MLSAAAASANRTGGWEADGGRQHRLVLPPHFTASLNLECWDLFSLCVLSNQAGWSKGCGWTGGSALFGDFKKGTTGVYGLYSA